MREVCEHFNEPGKCRECEAVRVINDLLNVIPVFPEYGDKIRGYREKYEKAIQQAEDFVNNEA